MEFSYQKSLENARTKHLLFLVFIYVVFFCIEAYLIVAGKEANSSFQLFSIVRVWLGWILFGITIITLPFFAFQLVRFYKSSGSWNIQITGQEVIWQSPENIGEQTFKLKISDIAKAIKEESRNIDSFSSYFLETSNGNKINLSPNSGINLENFCKSLEKLGVTYETQYTK
jgi:energy-coupling factor transporter transmembrane protein EcfT